MQHDVTVAGSDYYNKPHLLNQRINNFLGENLEFQNADLFPIRKTNQIDTLEKLSNHIDIRNQFISLYLETVFLLNSRIMIIANVKASDFILEYVENSQNYQLDENEMGLDTLVNNQNIRIPTVFFQNHVFLSDNVFNILYRMIIQNW